MIFVTSDHHFGHWAPWVQATRPFSSAAEMDAVMIERWNQAVGYSDLVYHLGDFTLGDHGQAKHYLSRLNGAIKVLGNVWHHDRRWISAALHPMWSVLSASGVKVRLLGPIEVLELEEYGDGRFPLAVTLTHFPFHEWDRKHYGAIQLHGHTHLKTPDLGPRSINVCVEQWDYTPVSLDTLIRRALTNDLEIGGTDRWL